MSYKDLEKRNATNNAKTKVYYENITTLAMSMLLAQTIDNPKIWHLFCNIKRHHAKRYPYSEDFTDEIFFEKMKDGCMYCGDPATTIDRINSSLVHTPNNCVGCCGPCNNSKGNGDPKTFIRKAYYRYHGKYFDDVEDIWSDNKKKPSYPMAKIRSLKQQRPFTLSRDQWDALVIGNCAYCKRFCPEKKWFGVDRIVPIGGYTPENTVTCCDDCNVDKWELDEDTVKKRNKKIADRLDNGVIVFFECDINLRNKGCSIGKKICAHGKVYSSYGDASRALEKNDTYIKGCLKNNRYSDDIFKISNDFYEFAIKTKLKNITKEMFNTFQTM